MTNHIMPTCHTLGSRLEEGKYERDGNEAVINLVNF